MMETLIVVGSVAVLSLIAVVSVWMWAARIDGEPPQPELFCLWCYKRLQTFERCDCVDARAWRSEQGDS